MIEFGKTLRTAREAKGMTTRQVADATHMMVQMVEGIENEDFSRIVAPIYGRGFVKLYCEAVGLEPKPLVAAFMELYNGSRSPSAAHVQAEPVPPPRPAAPPPQPAEPPAERDAPIAPENDAPTVGRDDPIAPQPETREPQPVHTPSLFDSDEPDVTPPPAPRPIFAPPPPPPAPKPAVRDVPIAPQQPVNRYAAPMPIDDDGFSIPTFLNWRLVVLAVAAAAIVAIAVLGVRFIYRATMTDPSAPQSAATEPKPDPKPVERATPSTPSKPAPKPAERAAPAAPQPATSAPQTTNRKPLPLKPFYIDSNHESQLKTDQKKKL